MARLFRRSKLLRRSVLLVVAAVVLTLSAACSRIVCGHSFGVANGYGSRRIQALVRDSRSHVNLIARRFFDKVDFNPGGSTKKLDNMGKGKSWAQKATALQLQDCVAELDTARQLQASMRAGGKIFAVTTESTNGIGLREGPEMDGPRTGDDLVKGSIFEVDQFVEKGPGEPVFMHLKDGRGWVFDNTNVKGVTQPCVQRISSIDDKSIAEYEENVERAKKEYAEARGASYNEKDAIPKELLEPKRSTPPANSDLD